MENKSNVVLACVLELNDSWVLEEEFKGIPSKELTIKVPEGCIGVQLVFDSRESAVKAYGEDVTTADIFMS